MMDANNYTYDYNPCAPITEGVPSVCDKVHVSITVQVVGIQLSLHF